MDVEFLKLFGTVFAALLPILGLAYHTGRKMERIEEGVKQNTTLTNETREAVRALGDHVNGRLGIIDFRLTGPDGENGLCGDMKVVKEKVEQLERDEIRREERHSEERHTERHARGKR
jgi:hypothetical protein